MDGTQLAFLNSLIDSIQTIGELVTSGDENSKCVAVTRLESAILASQINLPAPVYGVYVHLLEDALRLLINEVNSLNCNAVGRPKIEIQQSQLEYLLSMRFNAIQIAKYYRVSRCTVFRRLNDYNLSVIKKNLG